MKPKNIEEFQALVKRYETITLEEINKEWNLVKPTPSWTIVVARRLTGFGSIFSCTLCLRVYAVSRSNSNPCRYCVYDDNVNGICVPCMKGAHTKTYKDIANAPTPRKLFNAYRRRAKFLRLTYPQYLEK